MIQNSCYLVNMVSILKWTIPLINHAKQVYSFFTDMTGFLTQLECEFKHVYIQLIIFREHNHIHIIWSNVINRLIHCVHMENFCPGATWWEHSQNDSLCRLHGHVTQDVRVPLVGRGEEWGWRIVNRRGGGRKITCKRIGKGVW